MDEDPIIPDLSLSLVNFDEEIGYQRLERDLLSILIENFTTIGLNFMLYMVMLRVDLIIFEAKIRRHLFCAWKQEYRIIIYSDQFDSFYPFSGGSFRSFFSDLVLPWSSEALKTDSDKTLTFPKKVTFVENKEFIYEAPRNEMLLSPQEFFHNQVLVRRTYFIFGKDTTSIYRWDHIPILELLQVYLNIDDNTPDLFLY